MVACPAPGGRALCGAPLASVRPGWPLCRWESRLVCLALALELLAKHSCMESPSWSPPHTRAHCTSKATCINHAAPRAPCMRFPSSVVGTTAGRCHLFAPGLLRGSAGPAVPGAAGAAEEGQACAGLCLWFFWWGG